MIIAIIWTVLFLGAATFSYYNLREAQKDRNALKKTKRNGPYARVATGTIQVETSRVASFSLNAFIGILSVFNALPLWLFYTAMLGMGVAMLFNTLTTFRTRRDVMRLGAVGHHADFNTQQSPSNRKAGRLVGRTGRGRVGDATKRPDTSRTRRSRGRSR